MIEQANGVATEEEIASQLGPRVAAYQDSITALGKSRRHFLKSAPGGKLTLCNWGGEQRSFSAIDQEQVEELMVAALERMTKGERIAISLQFRERLTLAEIGFVMNLDLVTVSYLLSHGLVRTRSYLSRYWPSQFMN